MQKQIKIYLKENFSEIEKPAPVLKIEAKILELKLYDFGQKSRSKTSVMFVSLRVSVYIVHNLYIPCYI